MKLFDFEFERRLLSGINKRLGLRKSSYPLISGDTFRKFADLLFDSTQSCVASDFFDGCIVFVKTDRLWEFIYNIIPAVTNYFKLITHQSDLNVTEEYSCLADNKLLIHWFAQNCSYKHSKISPIPIGLEDRWWHNNGVLWEFKQYIKNNDPSCLKIVSAFNTSTNYEIRSIWKAQLDGNNCVAKAHGKMNSREYRHWAKQFIFIASPPGNGLDCHRTWEAMYMNMIPIVKKDIMTEYFINLKLPMYAIQSELELSKFTSEKLKDIKNELSKKSNKEALYADYWFNIIRTIS